MNKDQLLNTEPIGVEGSGELLLYATLYQDENFAILLTEPSGEVYSDLTINVPEEREAGLINDDEIVIHHDLSRQLVVGTMRPILDFLTDKPVRTVTYGLAYSIAIAPKKEIMDKLKSIKADMLSR